MPAFDKIVERASFELEEEKNLIMFAKSFSDESDKLVQTGEISERDKKFVEAFQGVYGALMRVEEKTRQLDESACNANADDVKDAKERLLELHQSLDRLQTAALLNPALKPFANRVTNRAREMSRKLEAIAEEEFKIEFDELYNHFNSIGK